MKKLIVLTTLAAAGAVAGWAPAAAEVKTPKVQVTTTRSQALEATFESKAGCLTTNVQVLTNDTRSKTVPSGTTDSFRTATLSVRVLDDPANGTDPATGRACGTLPDPILEDASVTIDNPGLSFDANLKSARLKGSARFFDNHTGTFKTVSFDIKWGSPGKLVTTPSHSTEVLSDRTICTVTVEQTRSAVAKGFLKEGSVNHVPGPSRREDTTIRRTNITELTTFAGPRP